MFMNTSTRRGDLDIKVSTSTGKLCGRAQAVNPSLAVHGAPRPHRGQERCQVAAPVQAARQSYGPGADGRGAGGKK